MYARANGQRVKVEVEFKVPGAPTAENIIRVYCMRPSIKWHPSLWRQTRLAASMPCLLDDPGPYEIIFTPPFQLELADKLNLWVVVKDTYLGLHSAQCFDVPITWN